MAEETLQLPQIRVRGRSFMALIVAPEFPLAIWLEALDQQMRASSDFFADRPIVVDLGVTTSRDASIAALDGLAARQLRVIGVESVDSALLVGTRWEQLPTVLHGRDGRRGGKPDWPIAAPTDAPAKPASPPPAPSASPALLIDRPVRSGQAIAYEEGDVIIVGSVASGAEVIAGGSIHVYGALRGRAIAGLATGSVARIFCRRLEAEMVAVDRLYRTAEHWGAELHGRAVQVLSDRGSLRLAPLD